MAGNHGGARQGAGRKPKAETHAPAIAAAEARIADHLPRVVDNLKRLADGEDTRVEERWEPAGTVTVKAPVHDADGNPVLGPNGKPVLVDQPAFPGRPADELVLVERKVVTLAPDYRANEYLANRILGKPTERHEVTGEDGEPFKVYVGIDLDRI